MAKRFTDNSKWDHSWFRKLPPKLKCAWFYILDKCDNAGVWTVDYEAMSFHVGETITEADLAFLNERVKPVSSDKILVLSFIEFQYGTLSEDCKPHKPVIERLRKLNLLEGYQKGFKTLEDKEQDKEQEKEKDKEKEKSEISQKELEDLYALYPRKEGKTRGLAKAKSLFKTRISYELVKQAIQNYRNHHETLGTEPQFLKHFDTFLNSWRDCLEPNFGTSSIQPKNSKSMSDDEFFAGIRNKAGA